MNPADGYSVLLVKSLRQGTVNRPAIFWDAATLLVGVWAGAEVGLLAEALVTGMEAAVQTVRTAPVIGLIAQVALLATLAAQSG